MKGNKIFDFSRKGFQQIINTMTRKINECVDIVNGMIPRLDDYISKIDWNKIINSDLYQKVLGDLGKTNEKLSNIVQVNLLDTKGDLARAIDLLPSNGGKILFPIGTYNISGVSINTDKNIVFEGIDKNLCIVNRDTNDICIRIIGNGFNSISFKNITFNGNNIKKSCINVSKVKNFIFEENIIKNFGVVGFSNGNKGTINGLYLTDIINAEIKHNEFNSIETDGVLGIPVKNIIVENNRFENIGRLAFANTQNENGTSGPLYSLINNNIVIDCMSGGFDCETSESLETHKFNATNNKIINCGNDSWGYDWGIVAGINSSGIISGNIITDYGKTAKSGYGNAIAVGTNKEVIVTNNIINFSKKYGIYVNSSLGAKVSNNHIQNTKDRAIFIDSTHYTNVENNRIENCEKDAIVYNLSSYGNISNNIIRNIGTITDNTYDCIKTLQSFNTHISNNKSNAPKSRYGVYIDNVSYLNTLNLISNDFNGFMTSWFNYANGCDNGEVKKGIKTFEKNNVPTTGTWKKGDYVKNTNVTIYGSTPNKYIVKGWTRVTDGNSNIDGTDWVADKVKDIG